ncbi:MAG: hypothetical protein QNJ49_21225 [Mastigocoleus sp. MO_167.B18]|nr:hypothetical protein [Mastigocoleus sp. MO_167.B18]
MNTASSYEFKGAAMGKLFVGPVELSENPNHRRDSNGKEVLWVGTTLKFLFQVKEYHEIHKVNKGTNNSDDYIYPLVIIGTRYVKTWEDWQQHEVKINDFLIGTICNYSSSEKHPTNSLEPEPPEAKQFIFKLQPKILRVSDAMEPHLVPQDKVNILSIDMGTGGFGFNDSFIIDYINTKNFTTNLNS